MVIRTSITSLLRKNHAEDENYDNSGKIEEDFKGLSENIN
jgi:hypothetical protein